MVHFETCQGKIYIDPHLNTMVDMVVCACYPSYPGSKSRKIAVQAGPDFKITKAKRARGMGQAVKCLPSKLKALSSNPNTALPQIGPKPEMAASLSLL
jgi:hypothetical protein